MSNTDGEYTLRIEKEAIAFADSIEVNSIATHTGLVKGYIAGAKELASLREQLNDRDIILKNSSNLIDRLSYTINENKKQLKQKEELILKQSEAIDKAWGAFNLSEHKLKQKEDENRELVEYLEFFIEYSEKSQYQLSLIKYDDVMYKRIEAKKLISRLSAKLGKYEK